MNVQPLAVLDSGQSHSARYFVHQFPSGAIAPELEMRAVAEFAPFGATLLGGHSHNKFLRDVHGLVLNLLYSVGVAKEVGLDVVLLSIVADIQILKIKVGVRHNLSRVRFSYLSHKTSPLTNSVNHFGKSVNKLGNKVKSTFHIDRSTTSQTTQSSMKIPAKIPKGTTAATISHSLSKAKAAIQPTPKTAAETTAKVQ
jgi:hypothetical protein